jgi:hypothetical protein
MAVVQRHVGGRIGRCFLIDIGAAEPLVDRCTLVDHPAKRAGAEGQFVAQAGGVEQAGQGGLHFVVAAGVVGAAVVVDVVVACGGEVVAEPLGVAAPGKRTVVIDHHLAARR